MTGWWTINWNAGARKAIVTYFKVLKYYPNVYTKG
jgi:hypothetical protein